MKAKFVFWDVQHGNACFIETPTGKRLAIDFGIGSYVKPADKTFTRPLRRVMWHDRHEPPQPGMTYLPGRLSRRLL